VRVMIEPAHVSTISYYTDSVKSRSRLFRPAEALPFTLHVPYAPGDWAAWRPLPCTARRRPALSRSLHLPLARRRDFR
jgi:hypothetical protein